MDKFRGRSALLEKPPEREKPPGYSGTVGGYSATEVLGVLTSDLSQAYRQKSAE